jgi:hypothetical protein
MRPVAHPGGRAALTVLNFGRREIEERLDLSALGAAPAWADILTGEAARRTGRSVAAVYGRRRALGLPGGRGR